MKILLIGYGKMGKTIDELARFRGHEIVAKIDKDSGYDQLLKHKNNLDVAIEFTEPAAARNNLLFCAEHHIPVVCGTTGWQSHRKEVEKAFIDNQGALFYTSNFSIGVNIYFYINRMLARLMKNHADYSPSIEEIHHIHKKDFPSGTALTLFEDIQTEYPGYHRFQPILSPQLPKPNSDEISILSFREGEVPGIHEVKYRSVNDIITIKHEAINRRGFGEGAVIAAEWLRSRNGIFGMSDLLNSDLK